MRKRDIFFPFVLLNIGCALVLGAGTLIVASRHSSIESYQLGLPFKFLEILVRSSPKLGYDRWELQFNAVAFAADLVLPVLIAAVFLLGLKRLSKIFVTAMTIILVVLAMRFGGKPTFVHEERDFRPPHWRTDQEWVQRGSRLL